MIRDGISISISQPSIGRIDNVAPSSVALRSPQEMKADGDAFARALGLGESGSPSSNSVNIGGFLQSLDAKEAKFARDAVKLAKKPDPVKMTAHLVDKSNAVLGLTFVTRMAGQFAKSVNTLTNMN